MDHSSMSQVQVLVKDSATYSDWCDRSFSYIDQLRPGYEHVVKWIKKKYSKDVISLITSADFDNEFAAQGLVLA